MIDRCPTCGESCLLGLKSHKCPPQWLCWAPDTQEEDDAYRISASDAKYAAQDFVENYENRACEYDVAAGKEEMIVHVKNSETGEVTIYTVSGELTPTYYAQLKEPK